MDQPEPKKRRLEGMSVEDRLRRSRERNREHARRTRQRKKAQLQTLQSRVAELQEEGRRLEEAFKDCSTANILLGLNNPAMARVAARQAISGAFYAVAQVAGGFHVGCACVGATRITLVCETPVFCFLLFCRRWLSRRSQDGFLLSRGLARLCGASRAAAISF